MYGPFGLITLVQHSSTRMLERIKSLDSLSPLTVTPRSSRDTLTISPKE